MSENTSPIPTEQIERRILLLRRQKVMLDFDLAVLYDSPARVLNQAVKRNLESFPEDFMFRLSEAETLFVMRSQVVTSSSVSRSNSTEPVPAATPQLVIASPKRRRLSHRPYAFTAQGVAMLSSVLRSPRAVRVNVEIMRAFVRLRQMLASNPDMARRLEELENRYDSQFKVVFDAIRQLMKEVRPPRPRSRCKIGFQTLRERSAPLPPRHQPKGPIRYRIRRVVR